jgi:hypothetical protein
MFGVRRVVSGKTCDTFAVKTRDEETRSPIETRGISSAQGERAK